MNVINKGCLRRLPEVLSLPRHAHNSAALGDILGEESIFVKEGESRNNNSNKTHKQEKGFGNKSCELTVM